MSVLICAPKFGGCGYVGVGNEWNRLGPYYNRLGEEEDRDYVMCPHCGEDHCLQIVTDNFDEITVGLSPLMLGKARELLEAYLKTHLGKLSIEAKG
jgi:hypothetical protein